MTDALARLHAVIRAEGGLLAEVAAPAAPSLQAGPSGDDPASVAASGSRAATDPKTYALLVEAVYEGYLLHYATPRVVTTDDPDLALLAGDHLYALGLARLAELGDLEGVVELADVISLCAQAHAREDEGLADAVWAAGALAVGHGSTPRHAAAKEAAQRGAAGAGQALREAAAELARSR
jgi:hypothetical protein